MLAEILEAQIEKHSVVAVVIVSSAQYVREWGLLSQTNDALVF